MLHRDGINGYQNNTFLDSSTNNATVTRTGLLHGLFSPYGSLWSNYFDGTAYNQWSGTSLSGDYTIECWFFQTAKSTEYIPIISGSTGSFNFPIALDYNTGSQTNGYIGAYSVGGIGIFIKSILLCFQ